MAPELLLLPSNGKALHNDSPTSCNSRVMCKLCEIMYPFKDVPRLCLCETWPRRPAGYNNIPLCR